MYSFLQGQRIQYTTNEVLHVQKSLKVYCLPSIGFTNDYNFWLKSQYLQSQGKCTTGGSDLGRRHCLSKLTVIFEVLLLTTQTLIFLVLLWAIYGFSLHPTTSSTKYQRLFIELLKEAFMLLKGKLHTDLLLGFLCFGTGREFLSALSTLLLAFCITFSE